MNNKNYSDHQIMDLLHGSIDGELSASEHIELNALLKASEKVREQHESLKSFAVLMDAIPEREPPAHLQSSIERLVRLPVEKPHSGRQHPQPEKQGRFTAWLPQYWLRTGIALTAGVLLSAGIYQVGSDFPSAQNTSGMTGTIVANPEPLAGSLLDAVDFKSAELDSLIELRNTSSLLIVDVQFDSVGAAALHIDFADRGLEYAGLEQLQEQSNAISIEKGSVHVASTGEQHYRLLLKYASNTPGRQVMPLALGFFADKKLVHQAELKLVGDTR